MCSELTAAEHTDMEAVSHACARVLLCLCAVIAWAPSQSQAGQVTACGILTKADVETVFSHTVGEGQSGKGSMPASTSCKYTYKKNGATYGVTLKLAETDAVKQEGFFASAQDVFARQQKARMSSEQTARSMKVIPNLGDEAFWNGYDLWVVKGSYCVVITASAFLGGTFRSSEDMAKARSEQDQALAVAITKILLAKLN